LGLLGRLGQRQPVVFVVEDLHLGDAATRAVITFLARVARDQRLAIVGTAQSDVVARDDPWSADLDAIVTGPQPPRRLVIPPLERPLTSDQRAAVAAAFEVDTSRPAPRSVSGPRTGAGALDADLWAGRTEALANGFIVEARDAIAFRHPSIGKAVARDLLPV